MLQERHAKTQAE